MAIPLSESPNTLRPTDAEPADATPVTIWLRQLEAGDAQAAQPLYEHFCERLQEIVRKRIPANVRTAYDQDDATASAFHSLFLGVRERRYQFDDRTDFWRLLMTIAERKVAKRVRYETRSKRDVRRVVQNSVFAVTPALSAEDVSAGVESLAGREPTPEFAAEIAETCESLLASLPDDKSRQIALLKLENHTAEEIAAKLGCTRRTVQRKLLVIRRTWQHASEIDSEGENMSQFGEERALGE